MSTIIINLNEIDQFIESSYGEDITEGKYKGWSMHEIDTSTGDFDAEKGAMYDYELIIEDPKGNLYRTVDGYYTASTGHVFYSGLEFESYIKPESFEEWIKSLSIQTLTDELKEEIIEMHYNNKN